MISVSCDVCVVCGLSVPICGVMCVVQYTYIYVYMYPYMHVYVC